MRLHLNRNHKLKEVAADIRKLIIKDLEEILEHKKAIINKKSLQTKIGKKSEFIPIDEENFKPKKCSKICQYCDYSSCSKKMWINMLMLVMKLFVGISVISVLM